MYNTFCYIYILYIGLVLGFPGGTVVMNLPDNTGDAKATVLIPGSGRAPGVGNGNPLQYSCLETLMERGAWWATVSPWLLSLHGLNYIWFSIFSEEH